GILRLITAGTELAAVLDGIARLCERIMPGSLCSILLADDALRLHHGAAPSLPQSYVAAIDGVQAAPGAGSCGTAVAERRLVIVSDIEEHDHWRDYRTLARDAGLRACWSDCIVDKTGRALGSFAVYYREPREPADWELGLIDGLREI